MQIKEEISEPENKQNELTFDDRVINCQKDLLEVASKSQLPASILVLLFEKLLILAEKNLNVTSVK